MPRIITKHLASHFMAHVPSAIILVFSPIFAHSETLVNPIKTPPTPINLAPIIIQNENSDNGTTAIFETDRLVSLYSASSSL